jgi:DNA primase
MIPTGFLHDLLARVDIVDVVGRYVQLKKGGANLMGLCPFHGEKSPSFSVSPSKQFYHCFGCGASGDAIRFLTEHTGASFVEAVNDLAQQVGMTVPEEQTTPAERERANAAKQRRATLTDVLAKAADHYRRQLKGSPRAIDYLKRRGLSGEIASQFGLGYAPEGWRGLASVFPAYDDPLLEESGMVIVKDADDGGSSGPVPGATPNSTQEAAATGGGVEGRTTPAGKRYDRFRDRIMFPIRSVQGDVIGFGGRVLDQGEPKYLNSPETPVFSKGRELYGLYEARSALRQRGYALVVEGYMDVVALAQSGFANAVATLGTACTADHVQKLFRFTDSVVFSFDGDAAGRRAARRALEASLPHAGDTRSVKFLFLPPEHDPDSFVRQHGPDAFERCVTEAVPLSRQIVEAAAEGCALQTAEGRAHMLANARPLWAALPDGALKLQVLSELAARAQFETADLTALWNTASPAAKPAAAPAPQKRPVRRPGRVSLGTANLLDRALWLLLHRSELWTSLDNESHDMLAGQPAPYDLFFACIERNVLEHGPLSSAALMAELRALEQAEVDSSTVLLRIAHFHDPEAQTDIAAELTRALDGLRLQAVEEELKMMFESGAMSPDFQARCKQLLDTRSRLKAQFAQAQRGPG